MIDLTYCLRCVVEAFDSIGVPYAVVGSTAAAAWGVARMTRDVDVVVVITPEELERAAAGAVPCDLYVPIGAARDAAIHGGSFNVLHPPSGGKVDLFVAKADDAFTSSRLARRVQADVLGVPTWVATPEDVVLAKLRWRLDTRSETQWRDCADIAAAQQLDTAYMWSWADTLGIREDLTDLLGGAGG